MAAMTAEQAAEAGKDLDFAKVWAALMETREQIAEASAKTDAQIAKMSAETAKTIKDLSANIGGVNNTLGKLTEEMVAAKVLELFQDLGYEVGKASRNIKYYQGRKRLAEVDVFLENGDVAVAVEVKTSLTVRDVNGHKECMSRLRGYMDEHGDKRKLIGAVAGGIVPDNVLEYAQQNGFYVLVQSGESICVAETAPEFEVKQW
ncbi:MAG: hypothetical protein MdMp014T_3050 [Treponematales bacterium]